MHLIPQIHLLWKAALNWINQYHSFCVAVTSSCIPWASSALMLYLVTSGPFKLVGEELAVSVGCSWAWVSPQSILLCFGALGGRNQHMAMRWSCFPSPCVSGVCGRLSQEIQVLGNAWVSLEATVRQTGALG